MNKSKEIPDWKQQEIPRSHKYENKIIVQECFITVRGIKYYMRIYEDESAELVRWGDTSKKWVFLLFPAEEKPDTIENIKRAIKQHFVL